MKYYKLTQEGIAEILGFSDDIVYEMDGIFGREEIYLREDEEIKIIDLVSNTKPRIEYEVYLKEGNEMYVFSYIEFNLGDGIVFSTEEKNMRVSQDKTLGELYEEIYEELFNKTFSFNNSVFLSNSILSEGTDYEEISEKEYKEHKVVTNFS